MPLRLRVPRGHRRAIHFLAQLGEDEWSELFDALDSSDAISLDDLQHGAAQVLPPYPEELSELTEALSSMSVALVSHGWKPSDMAHAIASSVDLTDLDDQSRERVGERLEQLLSSSRVRLVGKATMIVSSHQRVFHTCALLTDIRPIFYDDPSEQPIAAGVTHTLDLGYIENGKSDSIFLALDDEDLQRLIDEAKRAQDKANALRQLLERMSLQIYGFSKEKT